jgi:hypothetical protein
MGGHPVRARPELRDAVLEEIKSRFQARWAKAIAARKKVRTNGEAPKEPRAVQRTLV